MGNLRKRINVRSVNNKKDFLKYTSKPTYVNQTDRCIQNLLGELR